MEEHIIFNTEDVRDNQVYGILAYIGILFLVPIFAAKDSQYARFHANQGLVLFISEVLLSLVEQAVVNVLNLVTFGFLSGVISVMSFLLNVILGAIIIIYIVIGILNACSGEPKTLPIIGGITILQ